MNVKANTHLVTMHDCSHIEADTRIILHVLNCINNGIKNIYVRTNDTDVVVLLISYMPMFLEQNEVSIIAINGVGAKIKHFPINTIAHIGLDRCRELLFLHSLSGCDYTSSFFKVGKCKFWDIWLGNNNISKTFVDFSYCPVLPLSEVYLQTIETFMISLYDSTLEAAEIDLARYEMFKHKGDLEIRSLPPTKDALLLHIHRCAYVSGWILGMSHIPNATNKSPLN